jgi:xanthine dehydrogenase YagS FAD-binding subunit
MKQFDLYEPTSLTEATGFLSQFGAKARVVGGGSDLLGGIMKDWVTGKGMPLPDQIIDLTTIPDLKGIKSGTDGFHIGATTTLSELIEDQDLAAKVPLLGQAAASVASPLIRNFGTLGGNINQRPRCWFFRGENFACYKKGGDFCYAVTGDNRYHAIIGG